MSEKPHLRLFGAPVLLDGDGGVVKLRTRKQIGLLVYLAIEAQEQPVTRERLVDLLWPESEGRGLHSLSQGLSEIRKKWRRRALKADRYGVQLGVRLSTDLNVCDLHELPMELTEPLQGLRDCAGDEFALWVEATRDRIVTEVGARLYRALTEARQEGAGDLVEGLAERLCSLTPDKDIATQLALEERVIAGNTYGALLRCRELITDLEVDPAESAETLVSLRRFERALQHSLTSTNRGMEEMPPDKRRPDVFVGRESELARLDAICLEVIDGRFRTCEVAGAGGIGKSALLRRFSLLTNVRGVPSYTVGCQEMGASIPYAALSDLLDQMSRDPLITGTDTIWLAEASRVSPAFRTLYSGIPEPPETPPDTVRVRLAEAITRMLKAVGDGGPVFLVFDDTHYMDPASRDVLHVLWRRLMPTPTMLVAAVRSSDDELTTANAAATTGLECQERIYLSPLNDADIGKLVTALAAHHSEKDAPVQAIVEFAQGNPLVAEMLLSDWLGSRSKSLVIMHDSIEQNEDADRRFPDMVNDVLVRQFKDLPDNEQRLVRVLATAGRCVPLEDMPRLAVVESDAAVAGVYSLMERGIVSMKSNGLDFRNDLHRAFVYSKVPKETRKYLHAHLAQHLSTAKDQSEFQHALEASHHFLRAGWTNEAKEQVCRGADRAISCGAPKEAERALEAVLNALSGDTDVDIALSLAKAHSAQGSFGKGLESLALIANAEVTARQEAEAAHLRAQALHRGRLAKDNTTLASAAKEAAKLADEIGDRLLAMDLQQIAAEVAYEGGDWHELERIEEDCRRIESASEDAQTKGFANLTLGFCRLCSGDPSAAIARFSAAAKRFREIKLDSKLYWALNGIGMSASRAASFDEASAAFVKAKDSARRAGDVVAQSNALLNLGSLSNELGNFKSAAAHFRRSIELNRDISTSRVSTALYCNAANLSISIGNFDEAQAFLNTATHAAEMSGLWHHYVSVKLTQADLHLAQGTPELAWPLVREAVKETGSRHRLIPDLGQFWRLNHHYSATEGVELPTCADRTLMSLCHVLELSAFEEWFDKKAGSVEREPLAIAELAKHGLYGVLARLVSVGIRSGPLGKALPSGLSAAEVVMRVFPDREWEEIPKAVLGYQT